MSNPLQFSAIYSPSLAYAHPSPPLLSLLPSLHGHPLVRSSRPRRTSLRLLGLASQDLVLSLLVAVADQTVEERAGTALRVVARFGFLDLAVQVARRLFVDVFGVVVFVDVGCQ